MESVYVCVGDKRVGQNLPLFVSIFKYVCIFKCVMGISVHWSVLLLLLSVAADTGNGNDM